MFWGVYGARLTNTVALEDRYEYDAFGKPYQGDLTSGMNLGYTGKPYDTATGLYNYGYRDYKPEAARFTTVDPIRDGANWFAYVNNDPVNWVDLWGLECISASDKKGAGSFPNGSPEQNAMWEKAEAARQGLTFSNPLESMEKTSGFGPRTDVGPFIHDGLDLRAPEGTPVYAMENGTVREADLESPRSTGIPPNSYLIVDHGKGWESRYVHMDSFTVKAGEQIIQGQVLGYTGTRSGVDPHLHLEIRKDNVPRDPENFLGKIPQASH
jgi:RHS repeat-associated protein